MTQNPARHQSEDLKDPLERLSLLWMEAVDDKRPHVHMDEVLGRLKAKYQKMADECSAVLTGEK